MFKELKYTEEFFGGGKIMKKTICRKAIAGTLALIMVFGAIIPMLGTFTAFADGSYEISVGDSDFSTADLESDFRKNGRFTSDYNGRILADKSVLWGGDDASAFDEYDDDEFGITLSALAQSYPTTVGSQTEIVGNVHPDVVFIVDMSSSMYNNNVGNKSRAEVTVSAMNNAIANLMESDPETRIGIVSFATGFGGGYNKTEGKGSDALYLPLGTYNLPEGSRDYVLYDKDTSTVNRNFPNALMVLKTQASYSDITWLYPDQGTHSSVEYTNRTRIRVDSNGNYAFYNANSSSIVRQGTLQSAVDTGTYSNYTVALNSKYTLVRVGNFFYVYDVGKKTTTTVYTNVPNERKEFTTDGGDTFYAASYDGETINIYVDSTSSSPVAVLTPDAPKESFRSDDCDYHLTYIDPSSFSVEAEGYRDVTNDYAIQKTARKKFTIAGTDFYGINEDGKIRFYTAPEGGTPVVNLSDDSPSATYRVYNGTSKLTTAYTFAKSGNNSASVSVVSEKTMTTGAISTNNNSRTVITAGSNTYYAYRNTGNNYIYIYKTQTGGSAIAYLTLENTGQAFADTFFQDYTDTSTGVHFYRYDRKLDNGTANVNSFGTLNDNTLIVNYPASDPIVYETFTVSNSAGVRTTVGAGNVTFYAAASNGTVEIYSSATGGTPIATVSDSSATAAGTYDGKSYTFKKTGSSNNENYVSVTTPEVSTGTITANTYSPGSAIQFKVGEYTFYASTRQSDGKVLLYRNPPVSDSDSFRVLDNSASYTDPETGVTFTFSGTPRNNNYGKFTAKLSGRTFTSIVVDSTRTPMTCAGTTFYAEANGGTVDFYSSQTGGTPVATVSGSSTTATNNSFTFKRTARNNTTGENTVTIAKSGGTSGEYSANGWYDDQATRIEYNGITIYARTDWGTGNIRLLTAANGSLIYELTQSARSYTDPNTGVTYRMTSNTTGNGTASKLTVTLPSSDPITFYVTDAPRQQFTTNDGITFYVAPSATNFSVFTQQTGGNSVATVSSTNQTATVNISGTNESFRYYDFTHIEAGNPNSSSITLSEIPQQGMTTCNLETGDTIYLLVSNGAMNIYDNPASEPINEIRAGKVETLLIGNNKYEIKNNNNLSLTVECREVISAEDDSRITTVDNLPEKLAINVNGTTFYITITGDKGSQKVNVFDSATATTPIASSDSMVFTYNNKQYTVSSNGENSATIGYVSTQSSAGTVSKAIPSTVAGSMPSGSPPDGSAWHTLEVNPEMTDTEGNKVGTHKAVGFERGTYTQIGIKGAMDMLCANNDIEGRVPVIVLVSDGEPTLSHTDFINPQPVSDSGTKNGMTAQDGYRVIRTAMYAKQAVDEHYPEGKALFFSIGPGVTSQLGRTVLYPNCIEDGEDRTLLERCYDDYEAGSEVKSKELYGYIVNAEENDPTFDINYVDFCDWGVLGNLSETDIMNGFQHIVGLINDIPRPITAVTIVDKTTNNKSFDGKNMVFSDVIGEKMGLSCVTVDGDEVTVSLEEAPRIVYEDEIYMPTSVSSARPIYDVGNVVIGKIFTIVYNHDYIETSTNLEKNMGEMEVNLYIYDNGKQELEWKLPADLVPSIYPDADGTFSGTGPMRLAYQVHLLTDETGTYYTNSTDEPSTCTFVPAKGNPYYYETHIDTANQTLTEFNYDAENTEDNKDKEENITETAEYAWKFTTDEAGGYGVVIENLGNNGVISIRADGIAPDAVVIDFGLKVPVEVLSNDGIEGEITGIASHIVDGTVLNTQAYSSSRLTDVGMLDNGWYRLDHGVAESYGDIVYYTPSDMMMDKEEVIYYELQDYSTGKYYYSTVTFIPATIIYYEDTEQIEDVPPFIRFYGEDDWIVPEDEGAGIRNAYESEQHSDRPGAFDANNYGYDQTEYPYCGVYSFSCVHMTTVDATNTNADKKIYAEFEFTGNGFDVISVTAANTGTVKCDVYRVDDEGNETFADTGVVDTYYGFNYSEDQVIKNTWKYSNGVWRQIEKETVDGVGLDAVNTLPENPSEGEIAVIYTKSWITKEFARLYQIPVIKWHDLEYGHYVVRIYPTYSRFFDHQGSGEYSFYMDAVRIYNPAGYEPVSDVILDAYLADREAYPDFLELKDIITVSEYSDENPGGVLYLDGFTSSSLGEGTEQYKNFGPNNEVYLNPGQSFAFVIEDPNGDAVSSVQIAVRAHEDMDALEGIGYGGWTASPHLAVRSIKTMKNNKTIVIPNDVEELELGLDGFYTSTDLYFDVSEVVQFVNGRSNVILISNEISDDYVYNGAISITNIKITHTKPLEDTSAAPPHLTMNRAAALQAIQAVNTIYLDSITPKQEKIVSDIPVFEPIDEPDEPVDPGTEPDDPGTEPGDTGEDECPFLSFLKKIFNWIYDLFKTVINLMKQTFTVKK